MVEAIPDNSIVELTRTKLFKCQTCYVTCFTEVSLHAHHAKYPLHADHNTAQAVNAGAQTTTTTKVPNVIIKHMLACQPEGPCPEPTKIYRCHICQDMIGRKTLVNHLRKNHNAIKSDGFSFDPHTDMHPGHLACKHCHTTFTMDLALKTHFQRASCPVLLCIWACNQRFGHLTMSETQAPVEPARTSVNPEPIGNLGLWTDQPIPAWTNELAHSLLGIPMPKIVIELPFAPEARLTWFHQSIRWLSHHPDIPSSRLPQDSIFHFIAHLHEMHPVTWAWSSMEEQPTEATLIYIPDTHRAQVMDLNQSLHDVEHTLAQDWSLWCTHDGR